MLAHTVWNYEDTALWANVTPFGSQILYIHTHAQLWPLAVTYDFPGSGATPITPVLWCHQFSLQFIVKYDVIIQSTVQRYDPGKCEVTPVFPKCNINHSDVQKTEVLSKQVDQHLQNPWMGKIMSLVFGFNHRVDFILLHCDTLITMISTSGTYAFVVLKLHGSKMELAEQLGQLAHSLQIFLKYELNVFMTEP